MRDTISAVVPCYNEEESLPFFYDEIVRVAKEMETDAEFEFIFVNDGSKDKTIEVLRELRKKDTRVRYVSFSRNFGKEAAMYAGFKAAKGNLIVVLDADLQHPPKFIPEMYKGIKEEGYDCVATRRVKREGEPKLRTFFSMRFYSLINRMSDTEIMPGACDFRMMTRRMVDAVLEMSEANRFSKGIFSWVGFDTKWIPFENVARVAGETTWSFKKLLGYSIDGITAFSTTPLQVSSFLGILFCAVAFIFAVITVIKTLVFGEPVSGFPTIVCLILLLGGLQLLMIGILGEYLAKTYVETKKRPIYIVKETEEDVEI
ncbi:MAG: glycosyltransferase family 2 protein [Clostridia bacterium]|nr:glycosyltransferase family 2 protein [Clostridia bacterium]